MLSVPQHPGIYKITCTPTGKVYVGSAVDLRKRQRQHWGALRREEHHNPYLQRAWKKYGSEAFRFEILEAVLFVEDLLENEHRWIVLLDATNRAKGFNICGVGRSHVGVKRRAETRARMRKAQGRLHLGYVTPDGNPVVIDNMARFCEEHGLNADLMYRLSDPESGSRSYRGWTFAGNVNRQVRTYKGFISPTGNPVVITNLTRFCKEHGLSQSHMFSLFYGKRVSHKGWRHVGRQPLGFRVYAGFISPDGEHISITNLPEFCHKHNLLRPHMIAVYQGRRRSHKGWTHERGQS